MKTWIAFFRGINVGGKNLLPMKTLPADLLLLKCHNVRTYIQSGNVVFQSAAKSSAVLAKNIAASVEKRHGFRPHVLVMDQQQLDAASHSNPFAEAVADPKTLHFFFLAEPATSPDITAIESAKTPSEEFVLTDRVFYMHAPDGIGRSKLAANVEKHLGVVTTARNFRTVEKVIALATNG